MGSEESQHSLIIILFGDTRRRRVVTYSLLVLIILFSAAIGFGLAGNHHVSYWTLILFSVASVVALQIAWLLTLYIESFHGG